MQRSYSFKFNKRNVCKRSRHAKLFQKWTWGEAIRYLGFTLMPTIVSTINTDIPTEETRYSWCRLQFGLRTIESVNRLSKSESMSLTEGCEV